MPLYGYNANAFSRDRSTKLKATEHDLPCRFGLIRPRLPDLILLLVMQRAADKLDAGFYREAALAAFGPVQFIPAHMYQFAPEAAA